MNVQERTFTTKLRSCKTTFNNLYWGFLQTKQQELWQEIAIQYKKKNNSILHIVAFLYKIYISKSIKSITHKTNSIDVIETSPKPIVVVEAPPKPIVVVEKQPIKKQKFLGAVRHTPLSNYKEWRKAEMGIKTNEKIETKIFSEWKKEDNFDPSPKKYNKNVPWFNYINENMI